MSIKKSPLFIFLVSSAVVLLLGMFSFSFLVLTARFAPDVFEKVMHNVWPKFYFQTSKEHIEKLGIKTAKLSYKEKKTLH